MLYRILQIKIKAMYDGVELEGIIRSIRPFGAFVDVGSTTGTPVSFTSALVGTHYGLCACECACAQSNIHTQMRAQSRAFSDGLLHVENMLPHHRQYLGNELVVTASEGEQVYVCTCCACACVRVN